MMETIRNTNEWMGATAKAMASYPSVAMWPNPPWNDTKITVVACLDTCNKNNGDPELSGHTAAAVRSFIQAIVCDELMPAHWTPKRKGEMTRDIKKQLTSTSQTFSATVPQQSNDFDCGVWVI